MEECPICLEPVIVTAAQLGCGHALHTHCARRWFERSRTCPVCRGGVLPGTQLATDAELHAEIGTALGVVRNHAMFGVREGRGKGHPRSSFLQTAAFHAQQAAAISAPSLERTTECAYMLAYLHLSGDPRAAEMLTVRGTLDERQAHATATRLAAWARGACAPLGPPPRL